MTAPATPLHEAQAMRMPRLRVTVRGMMAATALIAFVVALATQHLWTMLIVVPLCGVATDEALGGRGIVGGMIAGCLAWMPAGYVLRLNMSEPDLFRMAMTFGVIGALVGGMIGLLAFGASRLRGNGARVAPNPPEPDSASGKL
jgi:hypothetical protein